MKKKGRPLVFCAGAAAFLFLAGGAARNETAVKRQVISLEGVDFVMVRVPPGEFMMGSAPSEAGRQPDEGPQRRVRIQQGFWMAETEVTQGQWKAVTGDDLSPFFGETPGHPVKYMSFDEALGFVAALNKKTGRKFRLPSEAEWEYACRAGASTPFSWGDSLGSDKANFDGRYPYGQAARGTSRGATMPVKGFAPNAWGLYDMHGNVWEWCQDTYNPQAYADQELYKANEAGNPVYQGGESQRVFRGGGWLGNGAACRSACRAAERGDYAFGFVGFRLAMDE